MPAERTADLRSDWAEEAEHRLNEPPAALIAEMDELEGDIIVLGAGGKLGTSVVQMACRAARIGLRRRVIAVSRFSRAERREALAAKGAELIDADLAEPASLAALPDAPNVVYLVGRKFGTAKAPYATWEANAYVTALTADRFAHARMVALSTGNVYPMVAVGSGGADEQVPPAPLGEYAQSCLARERLLERASVKNGTRVAIVRLNYAIDLRYGVLRDLGNAIQAGEPIDLSTGCVNVVWQGYVAAAVLRSLLRCESPPWVLNIAGPETASVRWLSEELGRRLGKRPEFVGEEGSEALLSNAGQAFSLFGYPEVALLTMLDWTAAWLLAGGDNYEAPTHFGERAGEF